MVDKKYRRAQCILSLFMITCLLITKDAEAGRDRGARCEKPGYIPNGSYRIRRDRVMRITCNSGFILQGSKTIDCVRGKWDGEKPVCAKKGCKKDLVQPENGRIQIENDVKAILYCSDSYNLAGNRHSYCNGTHWDRPIGNCREHKNIVQHGCDFETDDICGWTYEPREGLEWKRVMAANAFTSFMTGPRHDHTTLTANGGHYMLMESLTRLNDDVTLTSPIYDRELSLKTACCFQFYYFMYGAGVGDLFVVVKPVSLDLDDIFKNHKDLIKFQKYGNQNNIWNEAHFEIEELEEDFQIIFVAKSGRGFLSDIAVDDVKLLTGDECRALNSKGDEDISNEEYSTTYESIFDMQSCVGHCFESPGSGIIRTFKYLKGLCNCDIECEDNETCCPDFRAVCLNELFSQSTPLVEANEATQHIEVNYTSTLPTTTSTTARGTLTTSTTIKTSSTPTKITTSTIRPKTTIVKTTPTPIKTTLPTTTITRPKTTRSSTMRATTPTTTSRNTTPTTTTTTISTLPTTTTPRPNTTKTSTIQTTTSTTTTTRNIPQRITTRTTIPTTTTSRPKTTKTSTTRATTPTTTTRKITPKTTKRRKTLATTTARKTTPTSTTHSTTTRKTTLTLKTTISTTSTAIPTTTHAPTTAAKNTPDQTSTRRPPATSSSIEYIINDKSKPQAGNKGFSSLLLYTFFLIIILVLAGAAYKRFGDRAVAWYMIQFKHNNGGDEDCSSVTSTFKRPEPKTNGTNKSSKTTTRNKLQKSSNTKNIMKALLIEDDCEDDGEDDEVATNENIALKNHIYSEL